MPSLPSRLVVTLRALGPAGQAWEAELPALLASLEADWSITIGAALTGGQAAYVATASTRDGTPVVLKVALPMGAAAFFDRQLTALRQAGGDPYARLLRHDEPRRALLLERLGPPLADLDLPADRQLDELTRLAARGWRPVAHPGPLVTGAESARWHAGYISSAWTGPPPVVDLARRCAADREAAYDPARAVLVHGDVHAFNALRAGDGGFRLVDPEGLLSEPAADLGVIQARGAGRWTASLAAAGPLAAPGLLADSCRRAGELTGTDPDAIRQWAFLELASTGLFLRQLGHETESRPFLAAVNNLAQGFS